VNSGSYPLAPSAFPLAPYAPATCPLPSCLRPSVAALSVKDDLPTESADALDHSFWDVVRQEVVEKAQWMRRRGFFGATVFPWNELEYSAGPVTKMKGLQSRFGLEKKGEPAHMASGLQKEREQGLPRPFLSGGCVSCYVLARLEFAPGSRLRGRSRQEDQSDQTREKP
jgi:hypothetical protein